MSFLIAGLGNIGDEYAGTRHNIGFMVLDAWAKACDTAFKEERYGARAEVKFKGKTFILIKPSTYMNLSGNAVRYWLQAEKIAPENLLVVVDDLALPFGTMRMRKQGSDGGHNGLKHIEAVLGHRNYARLRMGIGNDFLKGRQIDYVLSAFDAEEKKLLPALLDRAVEAAKAFALVGIDRAMNNCN